VQVFPEDQVFPVGKVGFDSKDVEGRPYAASGRKSRKLIQHIFGYVGNDVRKNDVARPWTDIFDLCHLPDPPP